MASLILLFLLFSKDQNLDKILIEHVRFRYHMHRQAAIARDYKRTKLEKGFGLILDLLTH